MVLPLLLISVGGRKVPVVEQRPWRHCLLLSGEPSRNGGDFFQTEDCNRFELSVYPIPRVDAPIREGSATEESECRVREDIPEMGCREGLEATAPSTVKESPRRPCSG